MGTNYLSKDKINWKDQIVCPKCNEATKKQFIPNGGNGYWRCKVCKAKILDNSEMSGDTLYSHKTVVKDSELDSTNMDVQRILDSPSLIKTQEKEK